ncbi:MAG: hypothetical protein OHK0040_04900 [bacterium]
MGVRYLLFRISDKFYLCPEEKVQKVLPFSYEELHKSPYGPEHLTHLLLYDNEFIPLLNIEEAKKKYEQKTILTVIIKKMLFYVAIAIDEVVKFIEIESDKIDSALEVPQRFTKKALDYNGRECYLLDIDALFSGEE